MPSVWSKILMPEWSLPYNCYEIGHTWTPSCEEAALDLTLLVLRESIRVYTPLYLFNLALKRKFDAKSLKTVVANIFRSSAFLSFHPFVLMTVMCNLRKFTGKFYYTLCAYVPVFIGSLLAIHIEKPNRRGPLALYCANLASETVYRMLVNRNLIKPIPRGDVLLFTLSMSLLMYINRSSGYGRDPIGIGFRVLFGSEDTFEKPICDKESEVRAKCLKDENSNPMTQITSELRSKSRHLIAVIDRYFPRHRLCKHSDTSCVSNGLLHFTRNFFIGYSSQLLMSIVLKPKLALSSPKQLFARHLSSKESLGFGLFLGSFTAIYKLANCLLRWTTNRSQAWHSLVSVLFAGPTLLLSRNQVNTTLVLYLFWKCIEVLYCSAVRKGWLAYKDQTVVLLYSLSVAQLAYVAILEPRAMRSSYIRFLDRISGHKMSNFNRAVLDLFGTEASKGFEHVDFPRLDVSRTSRQYQETVLAWLI